MIAMLTLVTSCRNDDYNGPRFKFDAEGYCYLPDAPFVSSADFQKYLVGYAWILKYNECKPINEKGELYEEKYESLGSGTHVQFFADDSITRYAHSGKYLGYGKISYNYSEEKGILELEFYKHKEIFRILAISENELIATWQIKDINNQIKSYKYNIYKKLTDDKFQYYKDVYTEKLY